jgi:hypothetical protein
VEVLFDKNITIAVLQLSSRSWLLLLVLSYPADYSTELLPFGMAFVVSLSYERALPDVTACLMCGLEHIGTAPNC